MHIFMLKSYFSIVLMSIHDIQNFIYKNMFKLSYTFEFLYTALNLYIYIYKSILRFSQRFLLSAIYKKIIIILLYF